MRSMKKKQNPILCAHPPPPRIMEQKCISSADIDSTGCHTNTKTATATTADTPEKVASTAPYTRSPQMSSTKNDLQLLQPHKKSVCDKKIFENYEILKQKSNSNEREDGGESDNERGCSLSMSTPAADNVRLFKDDDSRSGSSDDVTTPHVDVHYLHQRHKQQNGSECNEDETPTSTNTLQVIQDHRRCHELENGDGVGVGIYLETPVVDEQIIGLNSHDYEKAKPKRLSDEFLLSSEDCCDDERNSSNDSNPLGIHSSSSNKSADCSVSNSNISVIQKKSEILNDLLRSVMSADSEVVSADPDGAVGYSESQFKAANSDVDVHAAPSGSMSFRFKNIKIGYNPFNGESDGLTDADAIPTDMTDNDVQSMDAIERRDFEHEQRLTGGIILKSTSLIKNDRLKLELLQSNNQNAKGDERAISSDSKCTYKDHSTTPTSSRHCSSRLTKSTAKINLSSSLSHSETITNGDEVRESQNQENELLDNNSTSPNDLHRKVQQEHEPGSSKSIQESSLSLSTSSSAVGSTLSKNISKRPLKLRSAALEGPVKNFFELFTNGNSNDSLTSEHSYSTSSSHSLSHLTKQQEPSCSGVSSSSSLNPDEELVKKDEEEVETIQALQQKSDVGQDDDVATTSSSARCQYSALRYMRNSQRKDSQNALNGGEDTSALSTLRPSQRRAISPTNTVSAIFALANSNGSNFHQQLNYDAAAVHQNGTDQPQVENEMHENEFDEETWADCEEGSDEEVCTCHKDSFSSHSKRDTSDMLSEEGLSKDVELSSYIQMVSISEDTMSHEQTMSPEYTGLQRKRKFNESRALDTDSYLGDTVSGRKRIAYDYSSTPRSSQSLMLITSPSTPLGRRTPRSIIPTRDNPPPELQDWLLQFQRWSHAERLLAVDRLIEHCEPTQVRHMMKVIEPQFQRDFISLLPRELALQVLAYLDPKDLLRAAQTCRSWRFLCDDNLLWKEKCRKAQILTEPKTDRPKRGRAGNMPPIASPWKAAYMRQHIIESNWRSRPIREPKVLKGHDDHVITCLQFFGNRIVSGSDDNTLKIWSAVTGRCLRTLVGHTGGVWSSQMSGNVIISGSTDRTLKVWDMETGSCIHTLLGHTSTVRCMHLHGKKVVSGSRDATLRVWDIERGSCLHVLVGHLAAVRCVQYDGKLIVSGAYDYMVKIWHPERQECLHTLQGHTNRVYSLQFDGVHVVSGSLDTSIRVWDVETGNCKHTLMGHQSLTSGMELRQNILVSGNADSTVKVWDITNGQCLQTLSGPNKHQSAVTCLQFNSRFVITSSDDGTVKLWDVKTGEFIRNLVALDSGGSGGVVWRIRANDTKLICAVGSRNGTEETKLMVLDFDVEGACVKCS